MCAVIFFFFFFNDTATTEIYTLSLHDALPIFIEADLVEQPARPHRHAEVEHHAVDEDRKSTRLNSSHLVNSYAVFCLKKNNTGHWLLLRTFVGSSSLTVGLYGTPT